MQHLFLLIGPADDFLEGGDEFALVVDEPAQPGQLRAGELAEIPRVLREDVEGAFLGRGLAEFRGMHRGRGGQAVHAARTEPHVAAVEQRTELEQDAVAVLQRADDRAGIATGEEMPVQRGERPFQVAAEKRLGGLEKIALGDIRRELGDVRLLDGGAFAGEIRELAHLLDQQAAVGTDPGEKKVDCAGRKGRAEGACLGEHDPRERLAAGFAVAADEREIGVFFAPFRKRAAAVHRRGSDERGDFGRIYLSQKRLQVLDEPERALGAAGDALSEEIHVLQPDDAAAAEHRHGLYGLAETVHRRLDLADVGREAVDDFTRELVGARLRGERVETLLAGALHEKLVGAADEGEGFGRGHASGLAGRRAERNEKNRQSRGGTVRVRVIFMQIFAKPRPAPREIWARDLLLLALCVGALFFFGLGNYPLQNPDEGRYAEIPREMVATGDFVTPRLNGVKYFEKPPLFYWCVAASVKLFGGEEWTLRAWPAMFAVAGVLMTYAAGLSLYGRTVGLAGAVVLATSLFYFALAHVLIIDMAVSVLISGVLFAFITGVQAEPGRRRRTLFYALYVCAALATLAKGLIGFLLPGAVMFLWLLIFNEWRRLRPFYLPTGALIFLAIAAPWHVLAGLANHSPVKEHDFTWFYFVREHWLRFTTDVDNRVEPFWWFAPIILAGLFPWIAFFVQSLRHNLQGGWAARAGNSVAWFCVVWAGFIFLFFSASHSKLVPYVLPVVPPLALLIGRYVALGWEVPAEAPLRVGFRVYGFTAGALAMALFTVWARLPADKLAPAQRTALAPFVTVLVSVLCTGGFLVPWLAARRAHGLAGAGGGDGGVFYCGSIRIALGDGSNDEADRRPSAPGAEARRPGVQLSPFFP